MRWVVQKSWDGLGIRRFRLYKTVHDRASVHERTESLPSHDLKVISLFSQITGPPFTNKGPDRYFGQVAPFVAHFTQVNRVWGTHNRTLVQFVKSLEM